MAAGRGLYSIPCFWQLIPHGLIHGICLAWQEVPARLAGPHGRTGASEQTILPVMKLVKAVALLAAALATTLATSCGTGKSAPVPSHPAYVTPSK